MPGPPAVPPQQRKDFRAWLGMHPVHSIELMGRPKVTKETHNLVPLFDMIRINDPKGTRYTKARLLHNDKEYVSGGFGVVAAYHAVTDPTKRIVVKVETFSLGAHEESETAVLNVFRYLLETGLMRKGCNARMLHYLGKAEHTMVADPRKGKQLFVYIALTEQNVDLEEMFTRPKIVVPNAWKSAFMLSFARAVACMHLAQPPISHGDIKPNNAMTTFTLEQVASAGTEPNMETICSENRRLCVLIDYGASDARKLWEDVVQGWYSGTFSSWERLLSGIPWWPSLPDDIFALGCSFATIIDAKAANGPLNSMYTVWSNYLKAYQRLPQNNQWGKKVTLLQEGARGPFTAAVAALLAGCKKQLKGWPRGDDFYRMMEGMFAPADKRWTITQVINTWQCGGAVAPAPMPPPKPASTKKRSKKKIEAPALLPSAALASNKGTPANLFETPKEFTTASESPVRRCRCRR